MSDPQEHAPSRPSIFDEIPEEEWNDEVDDDPGDAAPPGSIDVDIPVIRGSD